MADRLPEDDDEDEDDFDEDEDEDDDDLDGSKDADGRPITLKPGDNPRKTWRACADRLVELASTARSLTTSPVLALCKRPTGDLCRKRKVRRG
jgi:hypothetical protein